MGKTVNNKTENEFYDTYKKVRRSWNGVNPISRIEKDKTKYNRKKKHKGYDEFSD